MKRRLIWIILLASVVFMGTNIKDAGYEVGEKASDFKLKNVDGKYVSMDANPNNKGYIITFTCNTCPWARGYEQRIIKLHNKYGPLGYPVIAIQPNDPEVQPGDSFEAMQKRSKDFSYPFPYVLDEGQKMTIEYGAKATPHIFVVEKESDGYYVRYTGAIDDNPRDGSKAKEKYVEDAIGNLLEGEKVKVTSTKAFGCSIKWSEENKKKLGRS